MILTPDGEFLKSKKENNISYELGEEIEYTATENSSSVFQHFVQNIFKRKQLIAGVAALFLLMMTFLPSFINDNKVYAYVSIDINPSLELGVNKELEVIEIHAFNSDGELILGKLEGWKKEPIDEVTNAIIEASKTNGFLQSGDEVIISTTVVKKGKEEGQSNEIETALTDVKEDLQSAEVIVTEVDVPVETREQAVKEGISPAKFLKKTKGALNHNNQKGWKESKDQKKENRKKEKDNIEEKKEIKEEKKEKRQEEKDKKEEENNSHKNNGLKKGKDHQQKKNKAVEKKEQKQVFKEIKQEQKASKKEEIKNDHKSNKDKKGGQSEKEKDKQNGNQNKDKKIKGDKNDISKGKEKD